MLLTIIFLPLVGSIIAGFFGRYIGRTNASIITLTSVFISFILSCIGYAEVVLAQSPCIITLATWFEAGLVKISWGFLFDTLTLVMFFVVTSVSTCVHLYSLEYMKMDPHLTRFMSYLSLFTFFMLILVSAKNFVQMFLGWEGVGVCSYLLINFWYTRLQANKSAIKAMILNKIGDLGLALGVFLIFSVFKSVDYSVVFSSAFHFFDENFIFLNMEFNKIKIICLFLFIGAVGKSAQLGLHTWLPDAMEGPTPVSALIHAATMVTAGVFLIARCSPLFECSPDMLFIVTIVGAMTAFFAATTGLVQNDLKRVIAYSTCSQLGYMVFACGLSAYSISVFHLFNHAFFKALLFLSAGSVIHALGDEQDMRRMGALIHYLPFTYAMFFIGSLALMGFPYLTGFYSKDLILEIAYAKYEIHGLFAFWCGSLAAMCTSFYSIRLLILTFCQDAISLKNYARFAHDAPLKMFLPLCFLCIGSIFFGYIFSDRFVGMGTDFWGNAIFVTPLHSTALIEMEFIPYFYKIIPLVFSLIGTFGAYFYYSWITNTPVYSSLTSKFNRRVYQFLNRKWYFDKVYHEVITQNLLSYFYHDNYKNVDRGILELNGPYGLGLILYNKITNTTKIQTGYIYHYVSFMILGLFLFILFVQFNFLSTLIYFLIGV